MIRHCFQKVRNESLKFLISIMLPECSILQLYSSSFFSLISKTGGCNWFTKFAQVFIIFMFLEVVILSYFILFSYCILFIRPSNFQGNSVIAMVTENLSSFVDLCFVFFLSTKSSADVKVCPGFSSVNLFLKI